MPVMARNLLESIRLLAAVSRLFADRCLAGLEADVERCRAYAEATAQAAAALNRLLGYDKVAELVKESAATGRSIRDLVLEQGLLEEAEVDEALDLLRLTRGDWPPAAVSRRRGRGRSLRGGGGRTSCWTGPGRWPRPATPAGPSPRRRRRP